MPEELEPEVMPSSDFQGGEEIVADDEIMTQGEENQFDTNFDAGVEADEESDPEKYIQQLTGKLCTTINKYNEDRPEPDESLNKYVAGMVIAQCIKGLDEKDANEIIKKVTEKASEEEPEQEEVEEMPQEQEVGAEVETETEEVNEEKIVERIIDNIKSEKDEKVKRSDVKKTYKTSPYAIK